MKFKWVDEDECSFCFDDDGNVFARIDYDRNTANLKIWDISKDFVKAVADSAIRTLAELEEEE